MARRTDTAGVRRPAHSGLVSILSSEDRLNAARGTSRHDPEFVPEPSSRDARFGLVLGLVSADARPDDRWGGALFRQRSRNGTGASSGMQRKRSGSLSGVGPGTPRELLRGGGHCTLQRRAGPLSWARRRLTYPNDPYVRPFMELEQPCAPATERRRRGSPMSC